MASWTLRIAALAAVSNGGLATPSPEGGRLAEDDECSAADHGDCTFSALQRRSRHTRASVASADDQQRGQPSKLTHANSLLARYYPHLEYEASLENSVANCQTLMGKLIEDWDLRFYNTSDPDTEEYTNLGYEDVDGALALFYDSSTVDIQIALSSADDQCSGFAKTVVWFYPKADHNGAFGLNNWVCDRLRYFIKDDTTTCLNIYRVGKVAEISTILDKYTYDDSVRHSVIGGHGSDDEEGVLGLGSSDLDSMSQTGPSVDMLHRLNTAMPPGGTIFLDSCYSASNGLATFVSNVVPDVWVMGGTVSLDSEIVIASTEYEIGSDQGPPRIVSDKPEWNNDEEAIQVFWDGQNLGTVTQYEKASE